VVDVKHVRTSTGLGDVMGVDVSAPGASKIELTNDSHGIMNITKIKIIFPYLIRPTKTRTLPDGRLEDLSHDNHKNVQKECIKYLNHLIEIIRYKTGQFWIDYLSGQDVFINKFDCFDTNGRNIGGEIHITPTSTGFSFPHKSLDQSKVWPQIIFASGNDEQIPVREQLYLDSLKNFFKGRFNEAVMLMNIALESSTSDFIFQKLSETKLSEGEVRRKLNKILSHSKKEGKTGFHKILTHDLKEIVGRSLEEEPELWIEFKDARDKRKNTIHPHVKRLTEDEARTTMISLVKIMNWVWGGHEMVNGR